MHCFGNPRYAQSMIAYYMILTEYFVEILLKNSIVGMLLTCPIRLHVPGCTIFIPRVILLCLYREPHTQKTQKAPHHRPQTPSTENPNPKKPNIRPKTPNHHK